MSRPAFRQRRLEEAASAYQAFIDTGFPVTFSGNAETLQVGTDTDRSNWLIFKGALDDALAGGLVSTFDTVPIPIRCTSNNLYTVTFAEAVQMIADMRTWGFAAQVNCWRLKDAIEAATTGEDLNAVDLTEGWP